MMMLYAAGSPEEQLGRGARRARIHLRMPSGSVIGAAPATCPATAPPASADVQSAVVSEAPVEPARARATPEQPRRERSPPPTRSRRRQRSPSPAHRLRARPSRARRYTDEDPDSSGSGDDDGVALALQRSLQETPRGLRRRNRASTEERVQDAEPEPEARRPRRAAAVAAARNWQTSSPAAADDGPEHADAVPGALRQLRSSSRAPSAAPQGPDTGGATEPPAHGVDAAAAAGPEPLASEAPPVDAAGAAWPEDVTRRKRSGRTRVTADGPADERPSRSVPASSELRAGEGLATDPVGEAGPAAGSGASDTPAMAQVLPPVIAGQEPADDGLPCEAKADGPDDAGTVPASDPLTAAATAKADALEAVPQLREEGCGPDALAAGTSDPVVDKPGRDVTPSQLQPIQEPALPALDHALPGASVASADGLHAETVRSRYGALPKAPDQQNQLASPVAVSMPNGIFEPPEPADAAAAAIETESASMPHVSGSYTVARTETATEGTALTVAGVHPGKEAVAGTIASSRGAVLPLAAEVAPVQTVGHPLAEHPPGPEQSLH